MNPAKNNQRTFRLGLYLGRHAGAGGGIGLYAREILRYYQARTREFSNLELHIFATSGFLATCEPLPAQVRVHLLTDAWGRKCGLLLDLFRVGIWSRLLKLDLLHALSNYGCFCLRTPQLVTVHDLYQAWPPANSRGSLRVARVFYRALFGLVLPRAFHVVCDSASVATEVQARFRRSSKNTSVIPLGIDHELERYRTAPKLETEAEFLRRHQLKPGYTLVFAALDARKNFRRALRAWSSLPLAAREAGLVLKLNDESARQIAEDELVPSDKVYLRMLPWLSREELFTLYAHAGVSLIPSIAEGFGFPALEALTLGSPVVSPELDCLKSSPLDRVHFCDPHDEASIKDALIRALEAGRQESSQFAVHTMAQAAEDTLRLSLELMESKI